jgi:predicted HTH transcriptional regulator
LKKQHYIKELIAQGEGAHLDFKFEISDAAKIARSLVAFANTNGGKLLIGVKDNGVVRGIRSEEEYYMIEHAAQNYCRPQVKFTSKEWNIDGKKVLEIDIPFSSSYPHKAPDPSGKYKAYMRYEDQNILADGVLLKVWNKEKSKDDIQLVFTDDLKAILNYIEQNEPVTTTDIRHHFKLSKFKTEHLLSDLIIFDVIKIDLTDAGLFFYLKEPADGQI